jgi:hypothetical protein
MMTHASSPANTTRIAHADTLLRMRAREQNISTTQSRLKIWHELRPRLSRDQRRIVGRALIESGANLVHDPAMMVRANGEDGTGRAEPGHRPIDQMTQTEIAALPRPWWSRHWAR